MGKTLLFALSLLLPALVCATPATDTSSVVISPTRALHGLLLDIATAGDRLVAVGARGQVLLSDDQGQHWRLAQVPSQALLTAVFFADAQHGWAVGHDSQVLASTDGGEHWQVQHEDPGREAPLLDIWFANAQQGLAIGAYGQLLATGDGGAHWEDASERLDNPDQLHLNAIGASGDGSLFIVGEQGTLYRSRDAGEHWEHLDSPYQGSLFGVLATQAPSTVLIYGLRGNLLRSTDDGDSWQPVPLGSAESKVDSGLAGGARLADGSLVVVGNAGTVLRSEDDGRTFSAFIRPDRQALAAVTQGSAGELWLVGQGGARRTDVRGKGEGMQ